MKRFKSKKRGSGKIKIFLFLFLFSFVFSLYIFSRESNEKIIFTSINFLTNNVKNNVLALFSKLTRPEEVMYSSLNKSVKRKDLSVFSEVDDEYNYENNNTSYVEDPNPVKVKKPIVYIYNTHQLEEYSSLTNNEYNIRPNVLMASYILKEKLNDKNTPAIVETSNIKKYLNDNKLKYSNSYRASRHFIQEAKRKNPTLKYFIDLHRDSQSKDKTTFVNKNEKYAKILFVVGMEHPKYKKNLELAENLNYAINLKMPGLSKGISKKSGNKVNGIYNQDLSENSILIEVGGIDNKIEEVYNTIEVIADILSVKIERG